MSKKTNVNIKKESDIIIVNIRKKYLRDTHYGYYQLFDIIKNELIIKIQVSNTILIYFHNEVNNSIFNIIQYPNWYNDLTFQILNTIYTCCLQRGKAIMTNKIAPNIKESQKSSQQLAFGKDAVYYNLILQFKNTKLIF